MLKIGHRGAKGHIAENTIASFEKALELGVDMIELDVWLSKDGVPMVIHDETIDRTTNHSGFVNQFSSEFLQSIGIPSLENVFEFVNRKCKINVEIKDTLATKSVLDLIEKYINGKNCNYEDFLISSFHWSEIEEIANSKTKIPLAIITENNLDEAIIFAKKINCYFIHPFFELLDEEIVQNIKKSGLKIFPWTVNNFQAIEQLKEWNVDGIISDFPDRL